MIHPQSMLRLDSTIPYVVRSSLQFHTLLDSFAMLVVVASRSHSSCNSCDSPWTLATVLKCGCWWCACCLQHCGTLLSVIWCLYTWWFQMLAVATRCAVNIRSSRPRSTISSVRHDLLLAAPISKTLQRSDVYSSLFFVPLTMSCNSSWSPHYWLMFRVQHRQHTS